MRIQEAIDLSIISLCHKKCSWRGAVVLKITAAQRLAAQKFVLLEDMASLNEKGRVSKVALYISPKL